jgi:transposase InsO family protein
MFRVSERFACRVVGQHPSTHRHQGKVVDLEEARLRARLQKFAAEHIRWGRRMAYHLLRREGWLVNHKRVQRLWREEGLHPPTPAGRSGPGLLMAQCIVSRPNTPIRSGPRISSETPPLTVAGSISST